MEQNTPQRPLILPTPRGLDRPEPETASRKSFIRGFSVFAVLFSSCYLVWRAAYTVDMQYLWVALPLLIAETHNTGTFFLFTLSLWDRDVAPRWHAVSKPNCTVAVLIPTFNEPEEVLVPTIAASVALSPAHATWVLDDGHRPWVRELAVALGANYLSRPDNLHAKAGNLNYALANITADIIAVLDADHVPQPNFLMHTLGYFDDPKIAVVQTPQDFYNEDSFEHETVSAHGGHYQEESLFYRVIAPAKNRWDAAFWCGTSALVRVEALRSVGGVATDSITEDIITTMRMHRHGWKSVFHNEVLARGLAPSDAASYLIQRNRWARGAMQALRLENPLVRRGFSLGQRLAFFTTLFGWFDSWRTMTFALLPPIVLFTGANPVAAPGELYLPLLTISLAFQFVSLRLLARGYSAAFLSLMFEFLRLPAVLPATLTLFNPSAGKFVVTPKGRSNTSRTHGPVPGLLWFLYWITVASLVWFGLMMTGVLGRSYPNVPTATGTALFGAFNFVLIGAAIRRARSSRFAGERRNAHRFAVSVPARLNSVACTVFDLSVTGALVRVPEEVLTGLDDTAILVMELPDGAVRITCRVGTQQRGAETVVRAEFMDDHRKEQAAVARALFWGVNHPALQRAPLSEPLPFPVRVVA
jgi:cellulose synthase (UDP-forming)